MKATFVLAYVAGLLWIAGWELAAFAVNTQYTLSDLTWQWEGPGWSATRYFVFAVLFWLTAHLAWGWFR